MSQVTLKSLLFQRVLSEPVKVWPNHRFMSCSFRTGDTRCYRNVPGLGQKRNAGLTYSILVVIFFKIISLGTYTAILLFFHTLEAPWKSFFLILSVLLAIPFGCQTLLQMSSHQFHFQFGKKSKITGRIGSMWNDNHVVVSHKLCGFQRRAVRRIVVMKEQCAHVQIFC
jgi:hypothetical protein